MCGRHPSVQPHERCHRDPRQSRQGTRGGVTPEIQHAQPARHEQDAGLVQHVEARTLEDPAPRAARVGLLVAVAVPVERLQERRQRRPEKGSCRFGTPITAMPPGRRTRWISQTACSVSSKCSTVPIEYTASNAASLNGSARTSATAPRSGTDPKLRRASRAIGADRSTPNARAPRDAAHCRIRVFLASSHRSVFRIRSPVSGGSEPSSRRISFSR